MRQSDHLCAAWTPHHSTTVAQCPTETAQVGHIPEHSRHRKDAGCILRERPCSLCQPLHSLTDPQAAVNVSAETERFLEQFRFIIIGSQLLSERSKSAVHRRYDNLAAPNPTSAIRSPAALSFSLEGALVAAISPFLLAWGLQTIARKSRQPYGLHWRSISVIAGLFATVAVAVYVYARHKVRQRTRQSVLNEASRLTTASQAFDSISAGAFSLLAELEVISRGYEL